MPWATLTMKTESGFTLIEVIGVLAVMAILAALIAPNVIDHLDRVEQEAEGNNLQAIGRGVETYLRENRAWPANLAALSPGHVPFGSTQLTQNGRGFPRYLAVHPTTSGFSNATGIPESAQPDIRFLVISNVTADANPNISNATEFDTWWNTDETTTPDLKIYRGNVGHLFHLLSVSVVGAGGSYQIDGTTTNSGGGTLASHSAYHLVGTPGGLDTANAYGTPEVPLAITVNAGYQFNPNCASGPQWNVLGTECS